VRPVSGRQERKEGGGRPRDLRLSFRCFPAGLDDRSSGQTSPMRIEKRSARAHSSPLPPSLPPHPERKRKEICRAARKSDTVGRGGDRDPRGRHDAGARVEPQWRFVISPIEGKRMIGMGGGEGRGGGGSREGIAILFNRSGRMPRCTAGS